MIMRNLYRWPVLFCLFFCSLLQAQDAIPRRTLSLHEAIAIAVDSSLSALRARNVFMSSYWEYRSFKADRLPSLKLSFVPGQYNRTIVRRYDSSSDLDVFRPQQTFEMYGGVSLLQNIDLTGGQLYINTNLDYIRNIGNNTYTQYTTVPLRIGYSQNLIGYNAFRWEKRIAPIRYTQAQKRLIYNIENTSVSAVIYFFSLAKAQIQADLAAEHVMNADTLYCIGRERFSIAAISQSDLLTLNLDYINAQNAYKQAEITLQRAMKALSAFLNIDSRTLITLDLPSPRKYITIPIKKALDAAHANNPDLIAYRQSVLEREQAVQKAKSEVLFNASVSASVGFNQVAPELSDAYRDLLQQDIVALNVTIPIVDWGVRRGRYNMARNDLNVTSISAKQNIIELEEEVMMTVDDFNMQYDIIASTEEALALADQAYAQTLQRFKIGKADMSALTLSRQRQQVARQNYIVALEDYWENYYRIRMLTLFDFENDRPLGDSVNDVFDLQ